MLTTLLPWAALVLAVLALLSREGTRKGEVPETWAGRLKPSHGWLYAALVLALVALVGGQVWQDALKDLLPATRGFAAGIAIASLAFKFGRIAGQPASGMAAPAAFGVFGAAVLTLIDVTAREPYQLGAAAGVGLAAWLLGGVPDGLWASRASVFMILAIAADILGRRAAGAHSAQAGSMLGVLVVLGLILALGIPRKPETENKSRAIGLAMAVVLFAVGAWLLSARYFFINDLWILFVGGAGVGLIVGWLVPDEESRSGSFNFILSVIIWLGVATLAFGLRRAYGMSVATLGGAAMLGVLGRTRAMLTLGPLAILVVYRIFREMHTDASRALDIGQHYALIGLAIGASLPILASEWRASQRSGNSGSPWAALLWCPALLAVPYVGGVVLAVKGYIGIIAGLGFGTVIEGLRGGSRLEVLSLQAGLAMALVLGYGWVADKLNLARAEKVSALIWVAAGLGVIAAAIALLSRSGREEPAGSKE